MLKKKFQNKTVLITGASGYIGSRLTKTLKELNANVLTTSRSSRADFTDSEILNGTKFNDKLEIDYIFHLASPSNVFQIEQNVKELLFYNSDAILNLNKQFPNAKLIVFSTTDIYKLKPELKETVFNEQIPQQVYENDGRTAYIYAKLKSEQLASKLAENGAKTVILRISRVFGSTLEIEFKKLPALNQFVELAKQGKEVVLEQPNQQVRNWIWLDDSVKMILTAAAFGKSGEVYNITNLENEYSLKDVADFLNDNSRNCKEPSPLSDTYSNKKVLNLFERVPKLVNLFEGIEKLFDNRVLSL